MKKYMTVWFVSSVLVCFEYYALNFRPQLSLLAALQKNGFLYANFVVSPEPGRSPSLWLGWIGLGLMVIMNLYSMRKRFSIMQHWGKLSNWLNFHIFCGLLGPTFILFHCNFKVRGLVGISFWSMVVSFSSGIIGRYFYAQILKEKHFFENEAIKHEAKLSSFLAARKIEASDEEKNKYKSLALAYVGLPGGEAIAMNPFFALVNAMAGDIRLIFKNPEKAQVWPEATQFILAKYAVNKRRSLFLQPFQKLMGYWYTFHFPFAVFMYVVAAIHVVVALLFGV